MSMDGVADFASQGVRERLLSGGGPSLERMPLLRAVFDAMAADVQDSMRGLAEGAMQFVVEATTVARASDIAVEADRVALAATYVVETDPDAKTIIGADRRFVFTLLEGLFGSDGSEAPYDAERELTAIETRVGMLAFARVTKSLQVALASLAGVSFTLEPAENRVEPAGGPRKNGFSVVCRCRLRAFGTQGELFVAIPQATLDPLRDVLSQEASGAAPAADPYWAKRMKERVTQTEVTLSAVMEKVDLTLADVARFEVGQVIELPVSPTGLVALMCEGQSLFWCEIGQKDGSYTIRIDDFVDQQQEFIDDVLRG
ncbi:FliM/FliN family flagellar motor switch protein [Methylosinus sp. H3A]|uniref:FliM/FliN family flagellar motor switch protein n=1 Tax=Methylosinus sp. H3A TaxID=2785786 RepID=UPI0018C2B924|nr:FliM/FliN family flagellar motor switch protein [Methylosinus sp. H3A]MBG0808590.1 FliM/FliN family flagellar motor switch protein [Methylosinus sp. H3A]